MRCCERESFVSKAASAGGGHSGLIKCCKSKTLPKLRAVVVRVAKSCVRARPPMDISHFCGDRKTRAQLVHHQCVYCHKTEDDVVTA